MLAGKEMLMNRELPYLPIHEVSCEKMSSVLQLYGLEKILQLLHSRLWSEQNWETSLNLCPIFISG